MTTFTEFVTRLGDLSITGVSKLYDAPPLALNTADLPAQWVQFPAITEGPLTFQSHGGWPLFSADLVVAIDAVAQSTQNANFSAALTCASNVDTALRNAVGTIVKGKIEWASRVENLLVGEISYWVVMTEVTAHG